MASTTSSNSGGGGLSLRRRICSRSPSTTPSELSERSGSIASPPSLARHQPPCLLPPSALDSPAIVSSIGSRLATAMSDGSARSMRVRGATTVTLLKALAGGIVDVALDGGAPLTWVGTSCTPRSPAAAALSSGEYPSAQRPVLQGGDGGDEVVISVLLAAATGYASNAIPPPVGPLIGPAPTRRR